ncbi:heavy-metal-associated domain-containing protein [Candidatus Woesearchaeota archaeon]|nr:MAG: heavy-metal-associated domain-containing protein [Candidatus Woesearchaeota archaeon]
MKTLTLKVKGMHCKSCEMLIADTVGEIEGVKKVQSSFKDGKVTVIAEDSTSENAIKQAIEKEGYKL